MVLLFVHQVASGLVCGRTPCPPLLRVYLRQLLELRLPVSWPTPSIRILPLRAIATVSLAILTIESGRHTLLFTITVLPPGARTVLGTVTNLAT